MVRTALHLAIFSILVLGGSALAEDAPAAGVLRTFGDWAVTWTEQGWLRYRLPSAG
ncbi:MAG: hypothetical protein JWR51_494 [Devosia sp.]|nr:hypothetical protein [Devosia sp.]